MEVFPVWLLCWEIEVALCIFLAGHKMPPSASQHQPCLGFVTETLSAGLSQLSSSLSCLPCSWHFCVLTEPGAPLAFPFLLNTGSVGLGPPKGGDLPSGGVQVSLAAPVVAHGIIWDGLAQGGRESSAASV